ncbi:tryptophan halogenase family protein [Actinomadura rupiterrae]|uniref:tryptophan halogenase family protein n=1 Tax=Actinomadura rupiterrae TaxID=559627 RepID=UPI0020A23764|nr:tryptophan halogenase family protein [Actinomadura rupiterrae]MCP2336078.1 tryptophan halogenase [Actinomadura rupiterrae]
MARPIKRVVIVGGGTAGWLSAAYLNRAFGSQVQITLVESERVGRIGVGEATVPTLRTTFAFLGMKEEEWMPACNATYKSAVRFNDWRKPAADGTRHTYYHPFFHVPEPPVGMYEKPFHTRFGKGISLAHFYVKRKLEGDTGLRPTFGDAGMALQRLCELNKAPKPLPGSDAPDPRYRYAYHLDAALIAAYLRDLAVGRGVKHVLADVKHVEVDPRGHVERIVTEQEGTIEGDFFLDCTGFRGMIINGALGERFISQNDHLLCDSAVALPARNDPERDGLRPYTSANARKDGWIWEIPLYHRDGTGYVYCGKTTNPGDAEEELRRFLGGRAMDVPANHIKMRVGYNERSWVGNCCAVGLSSCFVEPLESTTIALIEYQLALLVLHFPDMDFDDQRRDRYNEMIKGAYLDLRDFIVMHYALTNRDDSQFWRNVREAPLPDSLQEKFAEYAESVVTPDGSRLRLFETRSIWAILTGMQFEFTKAPPSVQWMDDAAAMEMFAEVDRERELYSATLPGHYEYVRALHGAHDPDFG